MTPGIHYDVSFSDYLAIEAVNVSTLKAGERSMAHMREAMLHPKAPTKTMALGTLTHAGQLEPLSIAQRYVVMPPFELDEANLTKADVRTESKATKYYKQKVAAFEGVNRDKEIVSQADFDAMLAMVNSIKGNPTAMRLFGRGEAREATLIWEDEETGLLCKARADALLSDEWPTIGDLKTTADASLDAFTRSIIKFRYDMQGAWYRHGYKVITGRQANFVIVAIENNAPYGCACFEIEGDWLKAGWADCSRLLRQYATCLKANDWPGYTTEIQQPEMPRWREDHYGLAV